MGGKDSVLNRVRVGTARCLPGFYRFNLLPNHTRFNLAPTKPGLNQTINGGPISLNRVKPSKTGLKTISPSPDPARGRRTRPHHALGVAAWMAAAAFLPAAFLSLCTLPILVVMVLVVQTPRQELLLALRKLCLLQHALG